MAHADDATKTWVSAIPRVNADGNATEWRCRYNYTLNTFSHTFDGTERIEPPSKVPGAYTKAELLILMNKDHWDDIFNKKYNGYLNPPVLPTADKTFDIGTLDD